MNTFALQALDIAFFVLHSFVIIANVTGWILRRTRKAHLWILGGTAFSWFALGPLLGYQIGYCICTDWHWQIRQRLGYRNDPNSYIELLFRMAGLPIDSQLASYLAYGTLAFAVVAALWVNIADRWRATH
jgi:hypothetical protein